MIKIAIRDDDVNYFTKVSDLKAVYQPIEYFPISYAVIPTVHDVSTVGECSDTKGNMIPRYIGGNEELCSYISRLVKEKKGDILLHGITHQYKFINGKLNAEMEWRKNDDDLKHLIEYWKEDLSKLFDYSINCFVAPSNKITKSGIRAVYENDLNYSGIVPIKFKRNFTISALNNYIKRWNKRLLTKLPYPDILDYKTHKEINACILQSKNYLIKMFEYCNRINSPMVINVHYWHLRDNPAICKSLFEFIEYAVQKGAKPVTLSEIMNEKVNAK